MATRATKIVATLGPATSDPALLVAMLRAGVNVVRLNFSHGIAQDHIDRAAAVREAAKEVGREVAIKVLPRAIGDNRAFMKRFEREARAGAEVALPAEPRVAQRPPGGVEEPRRRGEPRPRCLDRAACIPQDEDICILDDLWHRNASTP